MQLTNKTILVFSPQSWGTMFVSKHHYAVALANRGNKVYFVNPPAETGMPGSIAIKPSQVHENLLVIDHRLNFPYRLKFHLIPVFHLLMGRHLKKLMKQLPAPVDVVWNFDTGYLYPFKYFPDSAFKIFHPVDEHTGKINIDSALGSDAIFSVTKEILARYNHLNIPTCFINHGISQHFLAEQPAFSENGKAIHVGMSGNLLRNDIDRETMLQIVRENPSVIFECWGSYQVAGNNFGYTDDTEQRPFITQLQAEKNVILHGPVKVNELARVLPTMDAFLICYDVQKDQSNGTNYHKIMEYLATGKIIVSNNVTTYQARPDLVQMVAERDSNRSLPALFKEVVSNLQQFNSAENVEVRKQFARENTYAKQVERIETFLQEINKPQK